MATEWKRRNLPHLTRPGATYFVTFCRHARFERSLTDTQVAPIIVQTLQGWAEARYVLYDYTVMPDHVHVILKPVQRPGTEMMPEPEHWALSEIMQGIKGNSARDINEALGREGSVWQAESHDHIVRGRRGYKAAARYIWRNPLEAGLIADPEKWPWWGRGLPLRRRTGDAGEGDAGHGGTASRQ